MTGDQLKNLQVKLALGCNEAIICLYFFVLKKYC